MGDAVAIERHEVAAIERQREAKGTNGVLAIEIHQEARQTNGVAAIERHGAAAIERPGLRRIKCILCHQVRQHFHLQLRLTLASTIAERMVHL